MTAQPSFSFRYDELPFVQQAHRWGRPSASGWQAPDAGLVLTVEQLAHEPNLVHDWHLRFVNHGANNTPILSDILPLDIVLDVASPVLHYFQGSNANAHDYAPAAQPLGPGGVDRFELTTRGGRSSNLHMPFFNLQTGDRSGVFIAVGWSGQWHARFEMVDQHRLRVCAGMDRTRFYLAPGEQVRSPRIVMLKWEGDLVESWNQWRRFLRDRIAPLDRGAACVPRTWANSWFTFDCGYGVNEGNQVETIQAAADLGIEFMVIDAGWYPCPNPYWWDGVGNWDQPRTDAFPNGFTPLFDAARQGGIGFGIWFEPERAALSSRLAREHPEWILGTHASHTTMAATVDVEHTSGLVNLGRRDVQDWLIDLIERYAAQGMAWFRHDCNIDPLDIWRAADAPDRAGIAEIRYVEGLYRVYDEIRRRHPDLFIEGCASGGRRLDLETITRNHGYWASDLMDGAPEPMQAHIMGFNHILLPHWHHTVLRDQNLPQEDTPAARYRFFSFLGGGPCLAGDLRNPAIDRSLLRCWIELFKSIRHLTEGDYYPLTPLTLADDRWAAFQFHHRGLAAGLVAGFRRPQAVADTVTLKLHGLDAAARYLFVSVFGDDQFERSGADAMAGLAVRRLHQPDLALYRYAVAEPVGTALRAVRHQQPGPPCLSSTDGSESRPYQVSERLA